ncbi:serine/threonine-protein kinase [Planktothricoides raciborskii]|uniref:Serine/threonine-protein kinase n=1 Tax=Planktothricoides raciborskii GIHE-MW2 TaxID=2792601 RepID=A0AAU8JJ02_9CYAN
MTYCINPDCQNPANSDHAELCQSCGSKLLLKNRYRAIAPLGKSKLGNTFLAIDQDQPSHPPCVIKQFIDSDAKPNKTGAFQIYAEQLAEIGKHPQIPSLLASFEQEGSQYIIQEYIEGQNLEQELTEAGTFNESQIRKLLYDLLPAIDFVHSFNLIHRDIKPENIIRSHQTNQLILVDFGTAETYNRFRQINPGTVTGSAEYAAPEQTKGKAVIASDFYSLGLTCLHLLTGLSAFDLFDPKSETWVWRDYLKTPVSLQLGQILDKMVQRDWKLRYNRAETILKDLRKVSLPSLPVTQNTRLVTAIGGATVALLSLLVTTRLPSPVPRTTITTEPVPYSVLEYHNQPPKDHSVKPYYSSDNLPPMRTLATTSGPVWSVAVSPNGKTIASGSWDGTIQLWHVSIDNARIPIQTLAGHTGAVWSVAISSDGKLLASGSADQTVKIWDLRTGELLKTLKGHDAGVFSVAFSPDNSLVASGSFDKTIKLWNIDQNKSEHYPESFKGYAHEYAKGYAHGSSQQYSQQYYEKYSSEYPEYSQGYLQQTLVGHTQEVQSVKFSPDGQTLASGSTDGTVKLWNVNTGKAFRTLSGHTDSVWSIAIAPDGKTLASGSWDRTVKLWNLETGELRRTLHGHAKQVYSVAFSPDGRTLASGDLNGTIKLWSTRNGCQKGTLKGHTDSVEIGFSADGTTMISGGFDDTIKMWRLDP